jgi:hypothetical protein
LLYEGQIVSSDTGTQKLQRDEICIWGEFKGTGKQGKFVEWDANRIRCHKFMYHQVPTEPEPPKKVDLDESPEATV